MILTRTPLRVSFFAGGTDYHVWYREHGGAVLSTAIDSPRFRSLSLCAICWPGGESCLPILNKGDHFSKQSAAAIKINRANLFV